MSNSAQNNYSVQSYQDESLCLPHNETGQKFQAPLTSNMLMDMTIILVGASSDILRQMTNLTHNSSIL